MNFGAAPPTDRLKTCLSLWRGRKSPGTDSAMVSVLNQELTMTTEMENAPSKTGKPSGPGRGNNPPKAK